MSTDTERRLVAIFAADVEGYSRLMGADEVGTMRDLTQRRAILDGLIATHGGRIANTVGDSVLAEFGSAVDAVRCAMEDALAKANSNELLKIEVEYRRKGCHDTRCNVESRDFPASGQKELFRTSPAFDH